MTFLQNLLKTARLKSPWIYRVNAGSCNGCDIEIGPCFCPRYDAEQLGVVLQGSPKHADILLVTGPVTLRTQDIVLDLYNQMPEPKAVVAVGSCPASGNVFAGSPTILGGVSSLIPVDVYVPGCPPRPQAIMEGIRQAARLLAEGTAGGHAEGAAGGHAEGAAGGHAEGAAGGHAEGIAGGKIVDNAAQVEGGRP